MSPAPRSRTVAVAIGVALAAIALEHLPWPAASQGWISVLGWSVASVALCVIALLFVERQPARDLGRDLGLVASPVPAAAIVAVASVAPMIVLLLAHGTPALPATSYLLPVVILGPAGEEIVFRGYLLRQLHRRARWSFWPAAALSAFLFGLAHVHGVAQTLAAPMAVVVPAVGGLFFAWLFARWKDNLWVPLGVHASMNFWWEVLHSTGDPAASQHSELARAVFVALVVVKTLRETGPIEAEV